GLGGPALDLAVRPGSGLGCLRRCRNELGASRTAKGASALAGAPGRDDAGQMLQARTPWRLRPMLAARPEGQLTRAVCRPCGLPWLPHYVPVGYGPAISRLGCLVGGTRSSCSRGIHSIWGGSVRRFLAA